MRKLNSFFQFATPLLLLASTLQGGLWYRNQLRLTPSAINGWSWQQHPRALLIYYVGSTGCACTEGLSRTVDKATAAKVDVVIVADQSVINNMDLDTELKARSVCILPSTAVTSRFWHDDSKTEIVVVQHGQIRQRSLGLSLPNPIMFE